MFLISTLRGDGAFRGEGYLDTVQKCRVYYCPYYYAEELQYHKVRKVHDRKVRTDHEELNKKKHEYLLAMNHKSRSIRDTFMGFRIHFPGCAKLHNQERG